MKDLIKTEVIEQFLNENNLSKAKFCKMCNISATTLNKILSNNTNFNLIALFRIAKVLNLKVCQMFN